jgi:hypothetical protein
MKQIGLAQLVGQREVELARRDRVWYWMGNCPGVRLVVRNVPARVFLIAMLMPKRETMSLEEAPISNVWEIGGCEGSRAERACVYHSPRAYLRPRVSWFIAYVLL